MDVKVIQFNPFAFQALLVWRVMDVASESQANQFFC